ncbi:hypothetical protein CF326_g10058, partial [Tilletia indica]
MSLSRPRLLTVSARWPSSEKLPAPTPSTPRTPLSPRENTRSFGTGSSTATTLAPSPFSPAEKRTRLGHFEPDGLLTLKRTKFSGSPLSVVPSSQMHADAARQLNWTLAAATREDSDVEDEEDPRPVRQATPIPEPSATPSSPVPSSPIHIRVEEEKGENNGPDEAALDPWVAHARAIQALYTGVEPTVGNENPVLAWWSGIDSSAPGPHLYEQLQTLGFDVSRIHTWVRFGPLPAKTVCVILTPGTLAVFQTRLHLLGMSA